MDVQKRINYSKLADELEGFYTVQTLLEKLGIDKIKAIYVIHKLREKGYVKTSYGAQKRGIYFISKINNLNRKSYTDKINEVSPIQLASWNPHYVYGKEIKYEEALIYAIKQRDIRYLIASIALFKKVKDWSLVYSLAKKGNVFLELVVLYEIARKIIKRLPKMPKKYFNLARKDVSKNYVYIKKGLSSNDFSDIEKRWKIYIPLNYSDLAEYRGIQA